MSAKWDRRLLEMAQFIAGWSKDPHTRVGAVIARPDRTVASMGFNGLPRGIADSSERLWDRDAKLAMTVHAEMNAILSSHVPVRGYTLYCTHPCCDRCAAHIIQAGIVRVVTAPPTPRMVSLWSAQMERARNMMTEVGIEVGEVLHDSVA